MADLVYLHGFASGPSGNKGRHCRAWANAHGVRFHAPDLNVPDFEHLTISAQVQTVEHLLSRLQEPPVVVGSSLGGLVAAAIANRGAELRCLLLLAPAFGFARRRLVGPRWSGYRKRGTMPMYHHASETWQRLGPSLLLDLTLWRDDTDWTIAVPTFILHGRQDESVPIEESRAFAARHSGCVLHEVEDDHSLLSADSLALLDRVLVEAFDQLPLIARE